ncbi:MAG: GGDEF domain-containing protein, partial [Alphaproteobacteria bacterium]|nr:GGDEF domain-containing protein [Alphaproteobacteria bacterium]
EDAMIIMERLRKVVSSRLLTMDDGSVVPATASLGAIMLDGQFSVQENLDRAGRALYAATKTGGDSVRLWSPDLESA